MNSDYAIKGRNQIAFLEQSDGQNTRNSSAASAKEVSAPNARSDIKTDSPFNRRKSGPAVQETSLTFEDFIDTINPLQHIPIVNALYREATGDSISSVAQVAGGALYGGAMGLVSGIVSAIIQDETGKDMGATAIAALTGDEKPAIPTGKAAPAPTMLAEAKPAASTQETPIKTAAAEKAKQPFGGVMAAPSPAETEMAAADDGSPSENLVPPAAAVTPPDHPPLEVAGTKFYSLAKVPRVASNDLVHMPVKDAPDIRLKPINRQAVGIAQAPAPAAVNDIPLASKDEAIKALGLAAQDESTALAAAAPTPQQGSQAIPKELIEDMMLMNMQKYQDGLKAGTLRGGMVDSIN